MSKIAVLILAAGKASRMGEPKQLLAYKGQTLLEHAIHEVQATGLDGIYVILGAYAEKIKPKIEASVSIIENENWKAGLSSSIKAGVQTVKAKDFDAVLLTLGDQPHVDTLFLNELINLHLQHPQEIIASGYAKRIGVPAIFPARYFDELLQLEGDRGAQALLNAKNTKVQVLRAKHKLIDIDTPEDYKRLLDRPS